MIEIPRTATSMFVSQWGRLAQKIRVPAGSLIGVVFLFLMHPDTRSLGAGGLVAAAGAALRIWAAGHIDKGRALARGGPYARTRNPLYLGSFLMSLGFLVAGRGYGLIPAFLLFYLVTYYPVMKAEEEELLQGYGADFLRYAARVPLFLPSPGRRDAGPSTFLWSRVIRNREHRTLFGALLVEAFLVVRALTG